MRKINRFLDVTNFGKGQGGYDAWSERLRDSGIRTRLRGEMRTPTDAGENLLLAAGAEGTLLVGFKNEKLKPLTGKTLAQVAGMRATSPEETAMDLVEEDDRASARPYRPESEMRLQSLSTLAAFKGSVFRRLIPRQNMAR